ncbi:hypothetical protein ALC53_01933 [Atta colombica]|uniref:Uncharacterized protein n=1 Tax=Atta colombica TaxID=520822 RepID=A0A195BT62_9HYME|nr:hypothetical protein ALC53_01933 [Atta colombica]
MARGTSGRCEGTATRCDHGKVKKIRAKATAERLLHPPPSSLPSCRLSRDSARLIRSRGRDEAENGDVVFVGGERRQRRDLHLGFQQQERRRGEWDEMRAEEPGAKYQPAAAPLRAAPEYPKDSKKVRRGRLNSRRKLQRGAPSRRSVSFRGDRSADVSIAVRRRNAEEGIISRRERSRGAKIDHVVMVSPSGTERPGPAPLIPPADQKGKKRNDEVPTHAARYLTGQSISLSREIIPGGDDDDGENHTFGPDNYLRVYRLYILPGHLGDNALL